jgi:PAS domain S-box-containing protein
MFGLSPRSFGGTFEAGLALVHPEDRDRVMKSMDRALEDLAELRLEHRVFDQQGEVHWVEMVGKTFTNEKGEPSRMLGTVLDVTERKKSDLELEQARERLRSLSHELLQVQESERRQIALQLHREVGGALAIIKTNLQAIARSLDAAPHLHRLQEGIAHADLIMQQVHDLSLTLRPPLLDDLGLEAALRWYMEQQTQHCELQARFVAENLDSRLDSAVETACFRVAQESITNAVRHSRATKLTVELRCAGGQLHLVVRDNGRGFDLDAVRRVTGRGRNVGLLGMEERTVVAGGRFECCSKLTQGTEINAWFPLKSPVPRRVQRENAER